MNWTIEQIKKAAECKTVDELLALAKEEGVDLTLEDAQKYLSQLTGNTLNLDEIEAVAGGCFNNTCGKNASFPGCE